MKQPTLTLLCVLLSVAVWAPAQTRAWQTGTLSKSVQIKMQEGSRETGSIAGYLNDNRNSFSTANVPNTSSTPDFATYQEFTIEVEQELYVVRQLLPHPWSKPAFRTVGEHVKFAVDAHAVYLIGDDGKQHKTAMVKVKPKVSVDQNRRPPIPS